PKASQAVEHRLAQARAARIADELRAHLIAHISDRHLGLEIGAAEGAAPTGMAERLGARTEQAEPVVAKAQRPIVLEPEQQVRPARLHLKHVLDRRRL